MTRDALEHLLRAAAAITNERDFIVIGSQAVLGQFPHAPAALLASIEADLYLCDAIEKSDLIDGAIGELSRFHETFGYYAHGVDDTTATLPAGWEDRLVPLHNDNTGAAVGWCLEIHDLASSKLVAARVRDMEFLGCCSASAWWSPPSWSDGCATSRSLRNASRDCFPPFSG